MKETMNVGITVIKSQICHDLKEMGDINFMLDILKKDRIREAWNEQHYFEAFYILGMLDYLSREHSVPVCTRYNDIRQNKLAEPVYPVGLSLMQKAANYPEKLTPIQEFRRFNIYEYSIRDVA